MKDYLKVGLVGALAVFVGGFLALRFGISSPNLGGDFPGGIVPSQLWTADTSTDSLTPVNGLPNIVLSGNLTAGSITPTVVNTVLGLSNTSTAGGIDFSKATGTGITAVLHSLAITQFTGTVVNSTGTWHGFSPTDFAQQVTAPANQTSTCTVGQISATADGSEIYFCYAPNEWTEATATTTW